MPSGLVVAPPAYPHWASPGPPEIAISAVGDHDLRRDLPDTQTHMHHVRTNARVRPLACTPLACIRSEEPGLVVGSKILLLAAADDSTLIPDMRGASRGWMRIGTPSS